ncbi:calcium-binding protein [Campylobacter sp.]|uniref:calcium-binding protein n=1 Tax=Campylobacter sp. TaxID=205 RepID=UPI0026F584D1|nr:calcium-binding protein [Campylobacter sp.]
MQTLTDLLKRALLSDDIGVIQTDLEKNADGDMDALNEEILNQTKEPAGNLQSEEIVEDQSSALKSVFLNQSTFIKSGQVSNVEARIGDSLDDVNSNHLKFNVSKTKQLLNIKEYENNLSVKIEWSNNGSTPKPSLSSIKFSSISDDSNSLDITHTKAATNINNATKYYTFSQKESMQTYSVIEDKTYILSDKTPTIVAKISAISEHKLSLFDKNLNKLAIDPSETVINGDTIRYTPKHELNDGLYRLEISGKNDKGAKISSNLSFEVDTTPIRFEDVRIEKDPNSDGYVINFNLLNFTDSDKFENVKVYMQNYDQNGNMLYSKALNLTQNANFVSARYGEKLNFADVIKIEATDAAGTTYTSTNKILIPTFTQIFDDHNTSVNTYRSIENWKSIELNDSGFSSDGSRIIINDDKPYFRAIIPDTTGDGGALVSYRANGDDKSYKPPAYINVVAKNVDSLQETNLEFQAIEKPATGENHTPENYFRLTGYSDRIGDDIKLPDGVYEFYMKGAYANSDVWLKNPIKFTIDSNAPKFENLSPSFNFDPVTNKTTISGKITDGGVSDNYKLIDHFTVADKVAQDSFELYENDGLKVNKAKEFTINESGNFNVEYDGEISEENYYIKLKDIAKNTAVIGNDKGNVIATKDGDDTIVTGGGIDEITSGAGDDIVRSGGGNDIVDSGEGNDEIYGEDGDDTINGGYGNDALYGGDGDDNIDGGNGSDRIYGGAGDDIINGGSGSDEIDGDDGDDVINGGDGSDIIRGGNGNDTINGGAGKDRIYGAEGDNVIQAGDGDDTVWLDIATVNSKHRLFAKEIDGGAGVDTLVLNPKNDDFVDFTKIADGDLNKLKNFEKIDLGGIKNIELKGLNPNDILDLDGGKNIIFKFEGTNQDKIYLKDSFAKLLDQTGVENGYERYGNNATADHAANSVKIDICMDIITDFI